MGTIARPVGRVPLARRVEVDLLAARGRGARPRRGARECKSVLLSASLGDATAASACAGPAQPPEGHEGARVEEGERQQREQGGEEGVEADAVDAVVGRVAAQGSRIGVVELLLDLHSNGIVSLLFYLGLIT